MVNARNELAGNMMPAAGLAAAEWAVSREPVAYEAALAAMTARATAIAEGAAPEVGTIKIKPQYLAFWQAELKPDGEIGLLDLALQRSLV